jgi:hypothetical protein
MKELNLNVTLTAKALLLATICVVLTSCDGKTHRYDGDFLSLATEQEFWDKWHRDNAGKTRPLEPFFAPWNETVLKPVNKQLISIADTSNDFVLVIRVNINAGCLEILSLAKDKDWRAVKWEQTEHDKIEKSLQHVAVQEEVLRNLSSETVLVDAPEMYAMDCDSVFVFLRYNGKCSRFGVYDPRFHEGIVPPGRTARDSLELLLRSLKLAPDKKNPYE